MTKVNQTLACLHARKVSLCSFFGLKKNQKSQPLGVSVEMPC